MATITIRRSPISGSIPASLVDGELAISHAAGDGTVWYKDTSGSIEPIRAGNASTASYVEGGSIVLTNVSVAPLLPENGIVWFASGSRAYIRTSAGITLVG